MFGFTGSIVAAMIVLLLPLMTQAAPDTTITATTTAGINTPPPLQAPQTVEAKPTIYFTTTDQRMLRVDAQGQNETQLLGPLPLQRMAYDASAQTVYGATSEGAIRRMNPDGTALETLLDDLDNPTELTLDPANNKMYWFDRSGAAIQRANLDGSGLETLVPSDEVSDGDSLILAPVAGKIYWIRDGEEIRRANLDGSGVETLVPAADFTELECLGLDGTNDKLYWVNDGGSNAAGSDLVLDEGRDHLYWANIRSGTIHRANTDGSSVTMIYSGPATPVYLTIPSSAGPAHDVSLYLPAVLRE